MLFNKNLDYYIKQVNGKYVGYVENPEGDFSTSDNFDTYAQADNWLIERKKGNG